MTYYPAFIRVEGRRCVVIGSGELADQKARELRDCGALVEHRAEYEPGVLAGALVAVDASGDPAVNEATSREAIRERVLLNVVDVTPLCDFIAPAVVRRLPLQVAISTGGESPFLASALRARLERMLGAEWGPFTSLVGRIRRQLRERSVPLAAQTAVYRALLASPIRAMLRRGDQAGAEFQAAALASPGARLRGRVALVGAGPGDPGLLTLAAAELLAEADHVLHDALVDPGVLAHCGQRTIIEDVGKRAGGRAAEQKVINARLIELALAGRHVVRLKGGDPFVFGRGGEELGALMEAGIETLVVPGVTSAVAAPGLAGIPLTQRGLSSSVAFVTARPRGGGEEDGVLERIAPAADTLVVLMGLQSLDRVAARLAAVLGGERPAAVISRASLTGQRAVRGRLAGIAGRARAAGLSTPATLVVGSVVDAVPPAAGLLELDSFALG